MQDYQTQLQAQTPSPSKDIDDMRNPYLNFANNEETHKNIEEEGDSLLYKVQPSHEHKHSLLHVPTSPVHRDIQGRIHSSEAWKEGITEKEINEYHVFIFANPLSGGHQSQIYLDMDDSEQEVELSNGITAFVHIYNLIIKEECKKAFAKMVTIQANQNVTSRIIIVIAGGDGSLIGTLMGAKNADVDIDAVPAVCLPYGTGNDLSRVTHWGGGPSAPFYQDIDLLVEELCHNSITQDFNVWNVQVRYHENGARFEVNTSERTVVEKPETYYERDMINYFGLGEDGRIGYHFDQRRTASPCFNKTIYCIVGTAFILTPCSRGPTIAETIEYVKTTELSSSGSYLDTNPGDEVVEEEHKLKEALLPPGKQKSASDSSRVLFTMNKKDKQYDFTKNSPLSLFAPNISSFAGGQADPWRTSQSIGLANPYAKNTQGAVSFQQKKQQLKATQSFDDDKLEMVYFTNIACMGLGRGYRVAQENGPLEVKFKRMERDFETFIDVDGEYFKIRNPDTIKVKLSTNFKHGRMKILVRKQPEKKK